MIQQPFPTMPLRHRLLVAAVVAVFTLGFFPRADAVRAQQGADAAKKADEEPRVPPPIKLSDDEWFYATPFDRLRLSIDDLPGRAAFISRNDKKTVDGKLSPEEWPADLPYKFESFDWNGDGYVDNTELLGVIVDVDLLDERPLPKPAPGAPADAKLQITLATGEHEIKNVQRSRVSDVKYFEDMLLDVGRAALARDELDKSFEFINFVAERQPTWRGLDQAIVDFWYKEAEYKMRREIGRAHV